MIQRLAALVLIFAGTTAFAHPKYPTCHGLIQNTAGLVTLRPLVYANGPIRAGENLVFAATAEGVEIGSCAAQVTVVAGHLVLFGLEEAALHGAYVVEGATGLVASILHSILG